MRHQMTTVPQKKIYSFKNNATRLKHHCIIYDVKVASKYTQPSSTPFSQRNLGIKGSAAVVERVKKLMDDLN